MNDNFGDISGDFLPEGYGDADSKVFQGIGMPAPEAGGTHAPQQQEAPKPINPAAAANSPVLLTGTVATPSAYGGPTATKVTSPDAKTYSGKSHFGASTQVLYNPTLAAQREREMFLGNLSGLFGASARNNTSLTSRSIVDGDWKYTQYSDGSIVVTGVPSGSKVTIGTKWPATNTYALAIAKKYPYPTASASDASAASSSSTATSKKEKAANTGTAVGSAAGAFVGNLIPSLAMFLGPTTAPVVVDPAATLPPDQKDLGTATPWGLILGIGAAVVVIGGGFYLATRHSNPETAQ